VLFRSRLEARWAAFFDSLQWPWSYEPLDLDGYIPDFFVDLNGEHVLIEVKPILWGRADDSPPASLGDVLTKWGALVAPAVHALVVGADLGAEGHTFGAFPGAHGVWRKQSIGRCKTCKKATFVVFDEHGARVCAASGCATSKGWFEQDEDLHTAFRSAGNAVRWKP
jgi:hypothetical protein